MHTKLQYIRITGVHQVPTQVFGRIKEMIPALGIFILIFPSATGLVCQKKYSEVHNLTIQGPGWNIDKKFGTEPIAQERCFTESSG